MKISKVAASQARRIFGMCVDSAGKLDQEKLRLAIRRIVEAKPRDYRGILGAIQRLVRIEIARRHVTIESAAALDAQTADQIRNKLITKYGNDLTFEYKVRPELLGGLRIQVGDDVWDSSVKSRLNRFATSF